MNVRKPIVLSAALVVGMAVFTLFEPAFASGLAQDGATGSSAPNWTSVIPPLLAIAAAFITRQVLFSLFLSIWAGAFLIAGPSFGSVFTTFFTSISDYMVPALADSSHASILLFTLMIGGMVGIITENGGTRGVIRAMTNFVKTREHTQLATSLLGFVVFFDDYANTMVVGNTMRPLTDRFKITRAKLAYLVDSTAAPIATVALVSTWIGAMVGFIGEALKNMPDYSGGTDYSIFLSALPYNFYAFFTIFFVLVIAITGKDFGPMLAMRRKFQDTGVDESRPKGESDVETEEEGRVSSMWNAVIPVLLLVFGTILGLFVSGEGDSVGEIIGSADSYAALIWGASAGLIGALVMTLIQKLSDVEESMKAMLGGMHVMFDGLSVLVFAWSLTAVINELNTAQFLTSVFSDSLSPGVLPVLVFVLAGITAFATGSSWGTMGILMPLVIPLMWAVGQSSGLPVVEINVFIYACVSSVLAGSVWGDHCSPISDTTILSSIASQCDHMDHVRTQMPYALVVGVTSVIALVLSTMLGLSPWLVYPVGFAALFGIVWKFGVPEPKKEAA